MIEPGISDLVGDVLAESLTDWSAYRTCPTCGAAVGAACTSMYSAIIEGRPDGDRKKLAIAHARRGRKR
jgi:hypothetical protein